MLLVAAAVTGGIATGGCGDGHTDGFIGNDGGGPYDGEGQTGSSDASYEGQTGIGDAPYDARRDATSTDAPIDAPNDGGDGG